MPGPRGSERRRVPGCGGWRLRTRVPGGSFERCEAPEQARGAASQLARFHAALASLPAALKPLGFPFHDMRRHRRDLVRALERHASHPLHSAVAELAQRAFEVERALPPLSGPAARVIHGDPKFNNLLFEGRSGSARETPTAWIDLDTVARLPLYVDFGDALRSWCNPVSEDEPRAEIDGALLRAAVEGYTGQSDLRLEADERDSLVCALERMSLELGIRFATDALEERHWNWDAQRFGSAGEHNLARARGQFDLQRKARAFRSEIERLLLA